MFNILEPLIKEATLIQDEQLCDATISGIDIDQECLETYLKTLWFADTKGDDALRENEQKFLRKYGKMAEAAQNIITLARLFTSPDDTIQYDGKVTIGNEITELSRHADVLALVIELTEAYDFRAKNPLLEQMHIDDVNVLGKRTALLTFRLLMHTHWVIAEELRNLRIYGVMDEYDSNLVKYYTVLDAMLHSLIVEQELVPDITAEIFEPSEAAEFAEITKQNPRQWVRRNTIQLILESQLLSDMRNTRGIHPLLTVHQDVGFNNAAEWDDRHLAEFSDGVLLFLSNLAAAYAV